MHTSSSKTGNAGRVPATIAQNAHESLRIFRILRAASLSACRAKAETIKEVMVPVSGEYGGKEELSDALAKGDSEARGLTGLQHYISCHVCSSLPHLEAQYLVLLM